jgi:hypothetical protein
MAIRSISMLLGIALMSGTCFAAESKQPANTPQASAPFDLTGYWTSVVTEDWLFRMVTPAKNDITSGVPANQKAVEKAGEWDLDRDRAMGEECRAFGAAAIMRQPGRMHISWLDEQTLQIEYEAGSQRRLLAFKKPVTGTKSWQGDSAARWLKQMQVHGFVSTIREPFTEPTQPGSGGTLKVVTNNLRPGYLIKNGVPYSGDASMVEFLDIAEMPGGDTWLVVTSTVTDPEYLIEPYVLSTHFKRIPPPKDWKPRPCHTPPPTRSAVEVGFKRD